MKQITFAAAKKKEWQKQKQERQNLREIMPQTAGIQRLEFQIF